MTCGLKTYTAFIDAVLAGSLNTSQQYAGDLSLTTQAPMSMLPARAITFFLLTDGTVVFTR